MKRNTHQSAEKALRILLAFVPNNGERTATEIARDLGMHISTVVRLLAILVACGFVYRDSRTKRYSLGRSAYDIGKAVYQSVKDRIVVIAQPYVDQLRDQLNEDVGLEVLFANHTLLAYRASGPSSFSPDNALGDRLPIYATAGGKAILAFSPPALVESVLREGLPSFTPNTITDPGIFRERLAQYREAGVAYDLGEVDVDRHFVSAPIFGIDQTPVAAVGVGGWAEKIKGQFDSRIIEAIKKTAAEVSQRLRH